MSFLQNYGIAVFFHSKNRDKREKKVVFFLLCVIFKAILSIITAEEKVLLWNGSAPYPGREKFRSPLPLFRRDRQNLRLLRYRADFLRKKSIQDLYLTEDPKIFEGGKNA